MDPQRAGPQPGLAREAHQRRLEVEHVEQIELIVGRRQQLVGAFEHVNAASPAARAAAIERNRRVVVVAQVDQRSTGRCVDLDDPAGIGLRDYLGSGTQGITFATTLLAGLHAGQDRVARCL